MATDTAPRGIRNNNPGNIRKSDDKWQGLSDVQDDEAFFRFKDPVYGIRALARVLITYQDNYDLRTINQLIGRWAPTNENNTGAYQRSVADSMTRNPNETLDMHDFDDLKGLVEGIILHENGIQPYTQDQIIKALTLAGVEAPKKSLLTTPQMVGSAITAIATAAQPLIETVKTQLEPLTGYSDGIKTAFVIVALIGVVIVVIAKYHERQQGVS